MNILLKSFDGEYCKQILEAALKDTVLDTCIYVANHTEEKPNINVKNFEWIPAAPLRAGQYTHIAWEQILPLDGALIEKMRECEATFMTMIERYANGKDISHNERKRQYMDHLRFWNDLLQKKNIDLVLLNHVPHQCYDYVLFCLAKHHGIQTLFVDRTALLDAFYVEEDWKTAGTEIKQKYDELQKEYGNASLAVELSPDYEAYFKQYTEQQAAPWFMNKARPSMNTSFVQRWWKVAVGLIIRKPLTLLRSVLSPSVWRRKLNQHGVIRMYDTHVQEPDLSKPYVYVPLHMQPEATTCPMGGVFMDQEKLVQLLASHLPKDVRIYVKEHPYQTEVCRSKAFYQSLLDIPSVTFVPRSLSTFTLTEHAVAIASVSGTAGFEGIFRKKPFLMFGYRFFQFAPGVFRVRSTEDCQKAVDAIFNKKETPQTRDLRLFLKAMELTATPYVGKPESPVTVMTYEEKAVLMGKKIAEKMKPFVR